MIYVKQPMMTYKYMDMYICIWQLDSTVVNNTDLYTVDQGSNPGLGCTHAPTHALHTAHA